MHVIIAPLKSQYVENTTIQWKSAGDEFTFYKMWGGHVPRVIYAPASIKLICPVTILANEFDAFENTPL